MLGLIILGITGVIVITLARMAAASRLPRNGFVGIRLPSTMRSDEAWIAGHRAASTSMTISGIAPVAFAVTAAAADPGRSKDTVLLIVGLVWVVGWVAVGPVQANRAAKLA
ncbi:MAG: SdpI family protein [Acidimicrobiales bacterium]